MTDVARLRMFAGPNGSGKTTVTIGLHKPSSWYGIYINADDIEKSIRETGELHLAPFEATTTTDEIRRFVSSSSFLQRFGFDRDADKIECRSDAIVFRGVPVTSYHASVLADFLRGKCLERRRSFTFETVMSARNKVDLLHVARTKGFRTYLYYVATEDPEINVERVKRRVAKGGHDVPTDKIVDRYYRSLGLLLEALRSTNRAFLFDTSGAVQRFFAEVTEGTTIELQSDCPSWFLPIWKQF